MIKTPRLLKLVVSGEIKKMHGVFIAKRSFLEQAFRLCWLGKILQASATKSFLAFYEPKTMTGTVSQLWIHFPSGYHHSFYFQFQITSLMYPFWFCKLEYRIPLYSYSYISQCVWCLLVTLNPWDHYVGLCTQNELLNQLSLPSFLEIKSHIQKLQPFQHINKMKSLCIFSLLISAVEQAP